MITRVCRESRAVAHETGRVLFREDDENLPDYVRSMWSDTSTDIVAQYWCPGLEGVMFWSLDDPDMYLFHWAQRYAGTMIAEARLTSALHLASGTFDWTNLARLRECFVCLDNPVMIHVSRKELLVSGLFGHLGEEYIQLVDPVDMRTLKKFHQLALTSSQQLPETLEFFEHLQTPTFQKRVRNWARNTMTRWIYQEWIHASEAEYSVILYPEQVWLGPREPGKDGNLFDPLMPGSYKGDKCSGMSNEVYFAYNEKHPWVKEKLARAPRFYPRIMIRPCMKRCWIPRTPPRRGSPKGHYRAGGR